MHVTLIRPPRVSQSGATFTGAFTPPISLAYLASTLIQNGTEVLPIDAIGEDPNNIICEDEYSYQGLSIEDVVMRIPSNTSLIGVSCMFTQDWLYHKQLIHHIRKRFPSTLIIAGGEHITALPENSLRDCPDLDYCILGEGEETITDLTLCVEQNKNFDEVDGVAFLHDNSYIQTPARKRIRAVDDIALPAWDLFPMETFLSSSNQLGLNRGRSMPILATRGCPFECTFCSNPVMYHRLWFARKPALVLDEIEHYIRKYHPDNFDFYDMTMVIRKDWILEFCSEIERRGLCFTWQLPNGTRSEVIDDEVARALHRAGCRNLSYAPESGSKKTLRLIKKEVNLQKLTKSIRSALRQGITVKCNTVIGFPHETYLDLIKTYLFILRLVILGVHDFPIWVYSPYPGTELFEKVRSKHFPNGLNKKYYLSLLAFMNLKEKSFCCDHVGPTGLNIFRIIGMSTAYGFSFLLRPWRLIQLINNFRKGKSETMMEKRLRELLSSSRGPFYYEGSLGQNRKQGGKDPSLS